ncbi:MAG: hypothetical protein PHI59_00710 [Candidatus Omnitrophica bacterium]|nr:hypothetical protein [Candidatus Omnitrophota bacterium]
MLDSIKKAFMLSVAAVKIFLVISAFNIFINVINLMVIPAPVNAEMDIKKSLTVIGLGIIFFFAAIFIQGGVITYIKELVKSGSTGLASFISNCGKYFMRMLGIILITILIAVGWGVLFLGILPAMLPALKVVFLILGFISLIGILLLLILPAYALVTGDLGVMASMRKGVSVAAANFLQIIGILIILVIISIVIMFIASLITGLLSIPFKGMVNYVAAVVMAISSAIVTLLADIAYMDFYLKKS